MTTDAVRDACSALDAATTAAFAAARAPSFTPQMVGQAVNPARRALTDAIREDAHAKITAWLRKRRDQHAVDGYATLADEDERCAAAIERGDLG